MFRLSSTRIALIGAALLLGVAVVVAVKSGSGDGDEGSGGADGPSAREQGKKVRRSGAGGRGTGTKSGRRSRAMLLEDLLARLPESDGQKAPDSLTGQNMPEDHAYLFRRLGKLQGEAALDEILDRYQNGGSYASMAMMHAVLGWMEVDREAAIAAFRELAAGASGNAIISWKGTNVRSGPGRPGMRDIGTLRSAMQLVLAEATRSDGARGFELLREDPWRSDGYFLQGVLGYTEGMPASTDWQDLREQLNALVEQRRLERPGDAKASARRALAEQQQIDLRVGLGWAKSDIDAAVDWYANQTVVPPNSPAASVRVLGLLFAVPEEDRYHVVDWFEGKRASGELDDGVVVKYASRLVGSAPDANLERLVGIPADEANRARIVAAFVSPVRKGGKLFLRHEPGQLQRLIDAAKLSEASGKRFQAVMASAVWEEGK